MHYTRLTIEEREKIHILVNQGKSNREIAQNLKRSHSTVSREVRKFLTHFECSLSKAHQKAGKEIAKRGRRPLIETRPELWNATIKQLIKDYSPERISKTFKKEHAEEPMKWISHETIDKYIYATPKGELKKLFIGLAMLHILRWF